MPPVQTALIDDPYYLGGVFVGIDQAYSHADFTPEMEATSTELRKQEAEMFAGEHDSSGEAWAELAPSTIARKGHDKILFETGALGNSLFGDTADSIRDVGDHHLSFGTSDEKAIFHQEGTRRMPARPPVGISEENIDKLCDRIADGVIERISA